MNPETRKGVMLTLGGVGLVILGALIALLIFKMASPAVPVIAPEPAPVAVTPAAPAAAVVPATPTASTPGMAQVTNVQAHYVVRTIPIRVCRDEPRTAMVAPPPSSGGGTSGVGALVGGLAGGALGNQVGEGRGRTAATIGGAVLGALAGNSVEGNMDQPPPPQPQTIIVPICHTRYLQKSVVTGYEVSYIYNGQAGMTIMKYAPVVGSTIPLTLQPSG